MKADPGRARNWTAERLDDGRASPWAEMTRQMTMPKWADDGPASWVNKAKRGITDGVSALRRPDGMPPRQRAIGSRLLPDWGSESLPRGALHGQNNRGRVSGIFYSAVKGVPIKKFIPRPLERHIGVDQLLRIF
jgi:hypothetical protein